MNDDGRRPGDPRLAVVADLRAGVDGYLTALAMKQPAVRVVFKRRRGAIEPGATPDSGPTGSPTAGGAAIEERRPRIHQVRPTAAAPAGPRPAEVPPQGQPAGADAYRMRTQGADAAAPPPSPPRRRARRDPMRAPGEVKRIVFEPPPRPAAEAAEPEGQEGPVFIIAADSGYAQVMAALGDVRATLDQALHARRFRPG